MRKVVLLCLLVFSITLHAQEHSENNTMENSFKNGTEIRSLSVEIGPSWINSKVYTSEGDFTGQVGVELGVEYAGIKVGGIDYGISFYHNETNIHGCKVSLNYIGPSLIYAHLGIFPQGRQDIHDDKILIIPEITGIGYQFFL